MIKVLCVGGPLDGTTRVLTGEIPPTTLTCQSMGDEYKKLTYDVKTMLTPIPLIEYVYRLDFKSWDGYYRYVYQEPQKKEEPMAKDEDSLDLFGGEKKEKTNLKPLAQKYASEKHKNVLLGLLEDKKTSKSDPPLKKDSPFIQGMAAEYPALSAVIKHVHGTRGIVAGGAFKNIFTGTPVKDIDVFFRNGKDWEDAYATLVERGYTKSYETKRVRALICPKTGVRVELVGNDYDEVEDIFDTPEGILSKFDFTITKFAVYLQGEEWVILKHKDFFEHLQTKRLVIDAELVKPISTFERTLRYTGYGYRMCKESKVLLIQDIQNTDFESAAQLGAGFYDGID